MAKIDLGKAFALLAALISGWEPTTSASNDLADAEEVVNGINQIDPGLIPVAELGQVESTVQGLQNLGSGQAAILASVEATFDGVSDRVVNIWVREYVNGTPPTGSPAAVFKQTLGY